MCGRFTLTTPKDIVKRFHVSFYSDEILELKPRYNIAPTQKTPVVYKLAKQNNKSIDKRKAEMMQWGYIPFWIKNINNQNIKNIKKIINARAESVTKKEVFKNSFVTKRCIIPFNGFYEWEKINKKPFYIFPKSKNMSGFAGLYSISINNKTNKRMKTFAIITTLPDKLVKKVHNRMPLILTKAQEDQWLNDEIKAKKILSTQIKDKKLNMYQVHKQVGNPKINNKKLIEKIQFLL